MNQENLSGKKQRKRILLCVILGVLCILSLLIGADTNTTLKALLQFDKKAWNTIWISRVPRTVAILLTASKFAEQHISYKEIWHFLCDVL